MHGRVVIALLVVVAAAIGGTAWWLVSDTSPPLSAQAIVENACDQTEGTGSFDIKSTATAPDQILKYDIRVSGDDFHAIGTIGDLDGKVALTVEFIGVDGITYVREVGGKYLG